MAARVGRAEAEAVVEELQREHEAADETPDAVVLAGGTALAFLGMRAVSEDLLR
ncbi:MAG: hypothetical protein JNK11_16945 [Alphaproteobacteria bacterium]|nr:hypothetical protein [Alphaproteobacteria bacterium]